MSRRRLISGLAASMMLATISCGFPGRGANIVGVDSSSTTSHVVFVFGQPLAVYGLSVVSCDGSRVMWTISAADVQRSTDRVVYGETPPGYAVQEGPRPLRPGCYQAVVSGPFSTRFIVRADGKVVPG